MKNVFGTNRNNQDGNLDGKDLIINEIDDNLKKEIDEYQNSINDLTEKASPSKITGLISVIAFICILIGLMVILKGLMDKSFSEVIEKNIIWVIVIIVSIISIVVIKIFDTKKLKKFQENEETINLIKKGEELDKKCRNLLSVPEDTLSIDVLSNVYTVKDGKEVSINNYIDYVLINTEIFSDDDNIYFYDNEILISVNKASIEINKHNDKIKVVGWNKSVPYNKGEYANYHIKADQMGIFHFKEWFSLDFNYQKTDYQIIVPIYDIDKVLKLVNKEIKQN